MPSAKAYVTVIRRVGRDENIASAPQNGDYSAINVKGSLLPHDHLNFSQNVTVFLNGIALDCDQAYQGDRPQLGDIKIGDRYLEPGDKIMLLLTW